MAKTLSGKAWIAWANLHAQNSHDLNKLNPSFKKNVDAFVAALTAAGATVTVSATLRHPKRAYLFHWAWRIGLGKVKASAAETMAGVDIEWDHGDAAKSRAAAMEMVRGFGLAVPPKSKVAPALNSNHIAGKAVDMDIAWQGTLNVVTADGKTVAVPFMSNVNANSKLHAVGGSYHVRKHLSDAPHWSVNGR